MYLNYQKLGCRVGERQQGDTHRSSHLLRQVSHNCINYVFSSCVGIVEGEGGGQWPLFLDYAGGGAE